MATPLNAFRTITATVTTTATNIYTVPIGVTGIILGSQVANIVNTTSSISAWHSRGVVATELVKEFDIPPNDAMSIIAGKLVLESGDSIRVQAGANNTLKITLSVLESANE
jgi:hypothetical protein